MKKTLSYVVIAVLAGLLGYFLANKKKCDKGEECTNTTNTPGEFYIYYYINKEDLVLPPNQVAYVKINDGEYQQLNSKIAIPVLENDTKIANVLKFYSKDTLNGKTTKEVVLKDEVNLEYRFINKTHNISHNIKNQIRQLPSIHFNDNNVIMTIINGPVKPQPPTPGPGLDGNTGDTTIINGPVKPVVESSK